jgi:hypothetical protein
MDERSRLIILNMIGMYLILIGALKNIECFLNYRQTNVQLLKTLVEHFPERKVYKKGQILLN